MNDLDCLETGHHYDIWSTDSDMNEAQRVCLNCSYVERIPMSKEILGQIKKQKIANQHLSRLTLLPRDSMFIGAVYGILDDDLNYLGKADREVLAKNISSAVNTCSVENAQYLDYFSNFVSSDLRDIDSVSMFYDKLDEFFELNRDEFLRLFDEKEEKSLLSK